MPKRLTLHHIRKIAARRKGECLSNTYQNIRSTLQWRCSKGHIWQATLRYIKRGYWCPYCLGQKRITIEEFKKIAKKWGGSCLSKRYVKSNAKLHFECAEGHRWWATANSIKNGHWCNRCGRKRTIAARKLKLDDLKAYALSRGGKCLADAYIHRDEKIIWECGDKHRWEASTASVVMQKGWCPICGMISSTKKRRAKGGLEELKDLAISRGGLCLSTEYQGRGYPMLWQCASLHEWRAKPRDIIRGGWCPQCSTGIGERICRAFFKQLFSISFSHASPPWLLNRNGNRMQLDGFSPKLLLAFEHHGLQHYDVSTHYVKDKETLKSRKTDDRLKRQLCEKRGIAVIEIPEVPTLTSLNSLRSLIGEQCAKKDIQLPHNFWSKKIDLSDAYSPTYVEQMKNLAMSRGGRFISPKFLGWSPLHLWECKEGHRWKSSPTSVKHQGTWCPICSGSKRKDMSAMQSLAASFGGKCLSKHFFGMRQKLWWACASGHAWKALPTNVQSGHWCPYCAGQVKLTIGDMRAIAASRGGKCLSKVYLGGKSKLKWQCSKGHTWMALPTNVKNKASWCRICAFEFHGKRMKARIRRRKKPPKVLFQGSRRGR